MAGEGAGRGSAEVSRSTRRNITWPRKECQEWTLPYTLRCTANSERAMGCSWLTQVRPATELAPRGCCGLPQALPEASSGASPSQLSTHLPLSHLILAVSIECQQNRRARLAIDFSTGWACISHASDVLGSCVMITSAPLRTEAERWKEEYTISRPARSYRWVLGRLGMT
jgi:hypothetical protein